jgi:hypothetical protein
MPTIPTDKVAALIGDFDADMLTRLKVSLEIETAKVNLENAQYALMRTKTAMRPSMYFPVNLEWDDVRSEWKCQHSLIEEAVGWGKSPNDAMVAFDYVWLGLKKND